MRWVELNWLEDAGLLGHIGRNRLAAILDLVVPVLAEQGIALPDPRLPDRRYFLELAAMLRSQPIKNTVYFPPFLAAGPQAQARDPPLARVTPPPPDSHSVRCPPFRVCGRWSICL